MAFVALATDIFWVERLSYGAWGLLRMRKLGFPTTNIAMGMWLFDSLLVLGIAKLSRISIIGPSLFFVLFTLFYVWNKRDLFI